MPTDSALAIGIFVGVCIGFADNIEVIETKDSDKARRTGVTLIFGKMFMIKFPEDIELGLCLILCRRLLTTVLLTGARVINLILASLHNADILAVARRSSTPGGC
jgi:hypothetical protein